MGYPTETQPEMREKATVVTDHRCETEKAAALARFPGKRLVGALIIAVGFASNPGSRANGHAVNKSNETGPSQIDLTWVAPDSCPDLGWVNSEIERLLGRPLGSVKEPRTQAAATVAQLGPQKWRLKLVTLQNNKGGERELYAEQCQPLARAAALILALGVDPQAVAEREKEAAGKVAGVEETRLQNPTDEAAAGPVAQPQSAPSQSREAPVQKVEPSPDSPPATEKATDGQPSPPTISPPGDTAEEDTPEETATHSVVLGAAFGADIGSLPKASAGGGVTAGVELSRWRLEVIAGLWPLRQAEIEEAPRFGAKLGLWTIAPGACYRVWTRGLSFAPCISVELGRIYGQGTGDDDHLTNSKKGAGFWLAPVAGARITWPVNGWVGIIAELGCAIPVLRHRFKLQIADLGNPVVVHRSAVIAPRARVGAELRF